MTDAVKGRKPKEQNRGHGEGSIYQRQDETWAGVSRYIDPETGKKKKHFVYGKTRKEVVSKKTAWEDEFKSGALPSKAKMTVEQWLDTWLETYKKNSVRTNTYEGYQRVVSGHLTPSIGNFILKDLRPEQVQKMLNQKLAAGRLRNNKEGDKGSPLSPRMVEYIYAVLHMALKQAVKSRLVPRNVCDAVDKRPVFNPLNMMFTDEAGSPLKPDYATDSFKRDLKRAKLPDIRFHDLRHGHATMLLELGEDITVISNRLGHSTITLTADTYSHVREKLQREASNKLEHVFNIGNR